MLHSILYMLMYSEYCLHSLAFMMLFTYIHQTISYIIHLCYLLYIGIIWYGVRWLLCLGLLEYFTYCIPAFAIVRSGMRKGHNYDQCMCIRLMRSIPYTAIRYTLHMIFSMYTYTTHTILYYSITIYNTYYILYPITYLYL